MTIVSPLDRRAMTLRRTAPLAGVLFAGLSIAGDFTIGPFPEGTTSGSALQHYYAGHGGQVVLGGSLFVWAAVCFGVFGVGLWSRIRDAAVPSVVAGLVLLGAAVETGADLYSGAIYQFLGEHGADGHIAPAALQAWQLGSTEIGDAGGQVLLMLGVTVAAFAFRAMPRWLAVAGLIVVAAEYSPVSFLASLVFLLWVAVAGVTLAVLWTPRPATVGRVAVPVGDSR